MQKVTREMGRMSTIYKMDHTESDMERLFVKRESGRRNLLQTETMHNTEIILQNIWEQNAKKTSSGK
jgi:hypothetical protein